MDIWMVSPEERKTFELQFQTLGPVNGNLSGDKVRGLFFQSKLPPAVLGLIWDLSDVNCDGNLNLNEFLVACKLIQLKLRGMEIPKVLPPQLQNVVNANVVTTSPVSTASPVLPLSPKTTPPSSSQTSQKTTPATSPQEWAVPHQTKLKYTQLFNATDKSRTGFLSGLQARNIMVATQLPQQILAQIWGLSDLDSDGQLSCEEFVLAMHLCDLAKSGQKIQIPLPPELIPPTFKRQRQNSLTGTGTTAAVADAMAISQTTFEDKRKENFEKGQAELERRRKALLEVQNREKEERERKERELEEKREKARLEQEKRRQEELERQLQRQKEIEMEKEEQRRKVLEQKEAIRKELERQRQIEWEGQRMLELQQQQESEKKYVTEMTGHSAQLATELGQLNDKVRNLSQKILETRAGVTAVKSTIDGMRSVRDTQINEMTQLKAKLKEQNQRLITISQEKIHFEALNKTNQQNAASLAQQGEKTDISEDKKAVDQLQEQISKLETQLETRKKEFQTSTEELKSLKGLLKKMVEDCAVLYMEYVEKRDNVYALKSRKLKDMTSWTESAWDSAPTDTQASLWDTQQSADDVTPTYKRHRALYEFVARNADELSFQPGDVILVTSGESVEPGWLNGKLRDQTGWFPESYVECIDDVTSTMSEPSADEILVNDRKLEEISEVPENISDGGATSLEAATNEPVGDTSAGLEEYYVALYPYNSVEPGDLCFEQNAVIKVTKKEGEWWTGILNGAVGVFPSNYVQKMENPPVSASSVESPKKDVPRCMSAPPTELESQFSQVGRAMTPDFSSSSPYGSSGRIRKPEVVTVVAPYQSTSPEQLNLQKGQLIMVRKKSDSGWWEGETHPKGQKRQVGWFPASYVKVAGTSNFSSSATSPVDTPVMQRKLEQVIALYKYTALNPDELSFEKDDIITVIEKVEPEWWKGKLNDFIGLFPSNYVAPL